MHWRNEHPHADPKGQRALLAAWLDDELAPAERAELDRHLDACGWCRDEVAAQREVRGLLRALPAPPLPRSFALPAAGPSAAPSSPISQPTVGVVARRARVVTTFPDLASTATRGSRAIAITQRVGGLAAALGFALLVGYLVLGRSGQPLTADTTGGSLYAPARNSSGAQATSPAAPTTPTSHLPAGVSGPPPGTGTAATATAQANTGATATTQTPTSATRTSQQNPEQTSTTTPAVNEASTTAPAVPLVGGGLLGGGLLVFVSAGVARRRDRRRPGT